MSTRRHRGGLGPAMVALLSACAPLSAEQRRQLQAEPFPVCVSTTPEVLVMERVDPEGARVTVYGAVALAEVAFAPAMFLPRPPPSPAAPDHRPSPRPPPRLTVAPETTLEPLRERLARRVSPLVVTARCGAEDAVARVEVNHRLTATLASPRPDAPLEGLLFEATGTLTFRDRPDDPVTAKCTRRLGPDSASHIELTEASDALAYFVEVSARQCAEAIGEQVAGALGR